MTVLERILKRIKALVDWLFRPIDGLVVGVNRYAPMAYSILVPPKRKK